MHKKKKMQYKITENRIAFPAPFPVSCIATVGGAAFDVAVNVNSVAFLGFGVYRLLDAEGEVRMVEVAETGEILRKDFVLQTTARASFRETKTENDCGCR